ncbi:unnamed protein product [Adineta steineri]|uniref:RING-type domain-containing protein n=1 Tax=Adineta steineri TaxID=433720 RepID=A0A815YKG2_9BILA|nr:unnamed protein product [Adineta steineri]CAF1669410.1 unnamed protein product [Adineta steineri]
MMRDNIIPLTEIDSLSKEIECIMCLNIVNDSRMCIHCSAIVCVKCIESWLNKQKSCPKCSHSVQEIDFVKCRLANKLVDFIETSKEKCCSNYSEETAKPCSTTCKNYAHSEFDKQPDNPIDEDYKQIMTLNYKLIDFIRKRNKDNQEKLNATELAIQMLFDDHSENLKHKNADQKATEILIKETEYLFDDYQQKKQVYNDLIKTDQSLINDMERRLTESKTLSDQEEILQILQKHIPSERNSV